MEQIITITIRDNDEVIDASWESDDEITAGAAASVILSATSIVSKELNISKKEVARRLSESMAMKESWDNEYI